jgi:hypothetical protein
MEDKYRTCVRVLSCTVCRCGNMAWCQPRPLSLLGCWPLVDLVSHLGWPHVSSSTAFVLTSICNMCMQYVC